MRIINQGRLVDFAVNHADSIKALNKWAETITIGNFKQPHDLLKEFPSLIMLETTDMYST